MLKSKICALKKMSKKLLFKLGEVDNAIVAKSIVF